MNAIGTIRLYRPDPTSIGVSEEWGGASVTATHTQGALVVSIRGEVDASNAARLGDYLERHAAVAGSLVVDTSAVDFYGASALAVLHRVDRCCARGGVGWRLVAGPALGRVMRVGGAADLPRAESVGAALRQLGSPCASVGS
ncbi:STAS domain-containing protein [Mycolicibacterium hodleri]|uniref:Anti-sigma factor antagonist n=1 Tax=Mycolicibacterium hodleri TaxID=49897 RepID=A0A502EEG4_9MYCO|nr:STAS domain-containing protein [Mycolicibacterium hodleri]TPG35664.1 anti-sigma factor antagonist [Mycolicibacterium hodleri]